MSGRRIVITGASSGVGAAAAEALTTRGNQVTVIGRDPERTGAVAERIGADYFVADFADLGQVRRLAEGLASRYERIDVLANNAGGLFPERRITVDGYELTFQVNHLAPFLLTNLLLDRLIASHGLVITTASEAHRRAQLDLNDLQLEHGWTSWRAYNRSKLANILFTRELHRRYVLDGIFAAAFHPGVVASGFAHDARWPTGWYYGSRVGQRLMVTPEQGADTLVWLADGVPPRDWAPGQYYIKRQISQPSRQARDAGLAGALWRRSAKLVGLPTEPQPVEQP